MTQKTAASQGARKTSGLPSPTAIAETESKAAQLKCDEIEKPMESVRKQLLLLLVLVLLSVILGMSNAIDGIVPQFIGWLLVLPLVILMLMTSFMIAASKNDVRLIICTTTVLIASAVYSMFTDHVTAYITCNRVTLSLALPYIAMAFKNVEQIQAKFVCTIVLLPLLVSNWGNVLTIPYRLTLLLPALTLIVYKSTALACGDGSRLLRNPGIVQKLLYCSGAASLAGSSVFVVALAADALYSVVAVAGFALAIAGFLAFSASLVVKKWENPTEVVRERTESKRKGFLKCCIFLLQLFVLYAIFQFCRPAVVLPLLYDACLNIPRYYRGPMRLKDDRKMVNKSFSLAVFSFILLIGSVWIATGVPLFTNVALANNTLPMNVAEQPIEGKVKIVRDMMAYITFDMCIIVIYAMMVFLLMSEKHAKQAADAEDGQDQEGTLTSVVIDAPTAKGSATEGKSETTNADSLLSNTSPSFDSSPRSANVNDVTERVNSLIVPD